MKVKDATRNHDCKHQPIIKQKIAKLTELLRTTLNNTNLPEDEIRITAVHLKKKIQILYKDTHQKNRDMLSAVDAAEGEHIGKTWTNHNKESKLHDTIKCLRNPNTNKSTKNPKEMAEIMAKYHERLQHDGHCHRASFFTIFTFLFYFLFPPLYPTSSLSFSFSHTHDQRQDNQTR